MGEIHNMLYYLYNNIKKEVYILNYGIVYHTNRDTRAEYTMSCTCGYNGKIDYSFYSRKKAICPQCGNTNTQIDNKYYNCFHKKYVKHFFWSIDINVSEKEIHVEKTNTRTIAKLDDTDGFYKIEIEKQDTISLDFNAQNINSMKILQNGKEKNINRNSINSALSHINIMTSKEEFGTSFENTIFEAYKNMSGEPLISKIVTNLYCFPQYEILYNTYKSLEMFSRVKKEYLQKANNPSDIFNIQKPVLRAIMETRNAKIFDKIDIIRNFSIELKDKPDVVIKLIQLANATDYTMMEKLIELYKLNFDFVRLKEYLTEDIYTFQGIDNPKEGLQLLYDYIHMCQLMDVSFEKYPKSLKLRHDLANKNLKIQISDLEAREMELVLNSKEYKDLVYDDKKEKYIVILPSSYKDIIEEGKNLHHCVGSYVDLVRKKETKILFMRNRENRKKSLITLEVRNEELRQYAGMCDRKVTEEEMKFLQKYCKDKKLYISEIHARNDNLF